MDGYAVRSADTASASHGRELRLKIIGESAAGVAIDQPELGAQSTARIFTGAIMPPGADAVVKQENVDRCGEVIVLRAPASPGENVRRAGEELRRGDLVGRVGERLGPGHLAALSNAGVFEVRCQRRPRASVLCTGNEVVPTGRSLLPGQVYEANGPLVAAWLSMAGAEVRSRHLPDDLALTMQALEEALEVSDLVITTGGVSVGDHDYIGAAAKAVGVETVFWKVSQKPGKPLFFGRRRGKLLLGLPGNPGATFVCLVVYVSCALSGLSGHDPHTLRRRGLLATSISRDAHRELLLRCSVSIDDRGQVRLTPLGQQASHMVSGLGDCGAVVRVPHGHGELASGTLVEWFPVPLVSDV